MAASMCQECVPSAPEPHFHAGHYLVNTQVHVCSRWSSDKQQISQLRCGDEQLLLSVAVQS